MEAHSDGPAAGPRRGPTVSAPSGRGPQSASGPGDHSPSGRLRSVAKPREWSVAPADHDAVRQLADTCALPDSIARLLSIRGIDTPDAVAGFLEPTIDDLHDPYLLHGMDRAVPRILQAIEAGQKIAVYGDFDVDGTASTAVLMLLFRIVGADAMYYIPSRLQEGYGLNMEAVGKLDEAGVKLLITVDNGITAVDEVAEAQRRGIDVIVTDHHQPGDTIPDGYAVLNPKLPQCDYPEPNLAGVGVAFKLAWAVAQAISRDRYIGSDFPSYLETAIALAGIATITDVVPLVGENRIFAAYGLQALPRSSNPGLRALLDISNLSNMTLDATHIGFRLGPRLNAGGRLGRESLGVELMLAESYSTAIELAEAIDEENRNRQTIEREITQAARERVVAEIDLENTSVIVLAEQGWHPGVVGIVASRLAEEFYRPSIVIALRGETGRGSARSIPGFSIYDALCECDDLLMSFGGHPFAAGMELREENVPHLRERVNAAANLSLAPKTMAPVLSLDGELSPSVLGPALIRDLERLAPHGEGNPTPLFASPVLELVGRPRVVGRNYQHLTFTVREAGNPDAPAIHAIAYNRADAFGILTKRPNIRLAFTPRLNPRSPSYVELVVRDLHEA